MNKKEKLEEKLEKLKLLKKELVENKINIEKKKKKKK